MPDFVQDRRSDLLDELIFVVTNTFQRFLKHKNTRRHDARMLDASIGHRNPFMQPKKHLASPQIELLELIPARPIHDLNREALQMRRKWFRELVEGFFDESSELCFADMIAHGLRSRRSNRLPFGHGRKSVGAEP